MEMGMTRGESRSGQSRRMSVVKCRSYDSLWNCGRRRKIEATVKCHHVSNRGLALGLPLGVHDTLRNTDQCQTFLDVPLSLHGMERRPVEDKRPSQSFRLASSLLGMLPSCVGHNSEGACHGGACKWALKPKDRRTPCTVSVIRRLKV
jgi:hypothetical protein